MENRKPYRIADVLSIALSMLTLITIISGGFFWFYKTNALPTRVAKTEERLDKLEEQLITNNTKTDLLLQAVYEIRGVLLRSNK